MIKKKTAKRLQLGTMDHISIRKHIHELECDLSEACNNYENTKSEAHLLLAKNIQDQIMKLKEKQKLSLDEITNKEEMLEPNEYKKIEKKKKFKHYGSIESSNEKNIQQSCTSFARKNCEPMILWSTGKESEPKKITKDEVKIETKSYEKHVTHLSN